MAAGTCTNQRQLPPASLPACRPPAHPRNRPELDWTCRAVSFRLSRGAGTGLACATLRFKGLRAQGATIGRRTVTGFWSLPRPAHSGMAAPFDEPGFPPFAVFLLPVSQRTPRLIVCAAAAVWPHLPYPSSVPYWSLVSQITLVESHALPPASVR